jgi:hypothetical protein
MWGFEFDRSGFADMEEPVTGKAGNDLGRDRLPIRWIAVEKWTFEENTMPRRRCDGMDPN